MANLSPKRTGLPFVVWISPRGGAQDDVCVKVTRGPSAVPGEFISVTVRPEVTLFGPGKLPTHELELLRQWIELNRDVLTRFWNGDIEYTKDAIAEIKALQIG